MQRSTTTALESLMTSSDSSASGVQPTRRALFSQASLAALSVMFLGAVSGAAPAAARCRARSRSAEDGNGIVVEVDGFLITVEQLDDEGSGAPVIGLDVAFIDNPDDPIYSSTHTGTLTDEMIELIELVAELDVGQSHVNRFNALLRSYGLDELAVVAAPEGGGAFVLIIVLFILLIIIGAGFGCC